MKNYTVIQDGIKDCGSACLLSIIRYYGGNISFDKLVEMTNTSKEGTNFYNMVQAGYEIGLLGKGYKISNIEEINNLDLPFISQVIIDNIKHFIVVYKIKNEVITVMDPAKGMKKIKLEDFKNIMTGYILTFSPYKKLPIYNQENYVKNILKDIMVKNKFLIMRLIILTFILTIFTCIYSYYLQVIIDKMYVYDNFKILLITLLFMIILFSKSFLQLIRNNLLFYFNKKIDLSIITTTIKKIIFLPYNYYKNKTTGEIISRVNDLFYIKNVIVKIIVVFFLELFLSVMAFIILFSINKKMTLLLLIVVVIYLILFLLFKPLIRNITNEMQEDSAKVNSLLVESINGYETVKGLNVEKNILEKISDLYNKSINDSMVSLKIDNNKVLLSNLFEGLIILLVTYIGITKVMDKSFSIGSLFTYMTLIQYFLFPIREIVDTYKEFVYVGNSIKRINNVINIKEEILVDSNSFIRGNIIFKELSFSYDMKRKIINNFNLKIRYNEKVLVLGQTGCGKSTLLKILFKYYDINKGMILIDNKDIMEYSLADIRKNMVMISQNEVLYTDTIRNNIIMDRDVEDNWFNEVVNMTLINEFVNNTSLGFDYLLEENGVNVSGGQRQRIILARALIKNANYYLIDEGLNQVDVSVERKLLKNIFTLKKTFIIISHRLENMDLYDKVVRVENGMVHDVYIRNSEQKGF